MSGTWKKPPMQGHQRAKLALDVFTVAIRQYLGAYLAILGGADAIVFTGGIGENCARIRLEATKNLEFAGIELDQERNQEARGETRISKDTSRTQIWTIPTNEELIVARQAQQRHSPGSACGTDMITRKQAGNSFFHIYDLTFPSVD